MNRPFETVIIAGIGLIGGSAAAALKALPDAPRVLGIDPCQASLDSALAAGALDEAALPNSPLIDEWLAAAGEDTLFLIATPVFAAGEWFEKLAAANFPGVISDTASTKGVICGMAAAALSEGQLTRYLPGHPMAGSEVNGFSGARPDLYQGAYWILCPEPLTLDDVYLRMHELFATLGARVISIPREDHDSAVAIVSHVPHMVASSLVELAGAHAGERKELLRLAAGGFKDTTRIASGSPQLWCGIAMDNRDALADGLRELGEILGRFERAVREEDTTTLTQMLASSAELRRSLPARWIPDSSKLVQLRIPMTDRAGIIAEVTGMAGHAGCNIQSIDIDHINESTAVLELILTDEGDMGKLSGQLIAAGFDVAFKNLIG